MAVTNTGWSGTVSLTISRTQVDVHNTMASVTATADAPLDGPYNLSIYDADSHQLIATCNQSTCGGTSRNVTSNNVSTTTNATRHFVAYVAQDAPGNYTLPSNDVRATSNTVAVTNTGWSGTVSLTISRTQVDVHNTMASVTATADAPLDGPYNLSIYDADSHQLIATCNQSTCGGTSRNVTSNNVSTTTNATRHFVAYVAQDAPGNYTLPSNDVRATSNTVAVTNTGWSGTVSLTISRTQVDVHNTMASVTATADAPLDGPYNLSIYDADSHQLIATCNQSTCGGTSRNVTSNNVSTTTNATRHFVAYVAQDAPGNYTLPSNDVRATSNTVAVTNTGWSGTVSLTISRTQVDVHNTMASVTATADAPLDGPYNLSIYDADSHQLIATCNQSTCGGTSRNVTSNNVSTTTNATRHFVAYVAQDAPGNYTLPSNDVRATSNTVAVTNTGWSGTVSLTISRTQVDVHNTMASVTATADAPLDGPYNLSIYDADSHQLIATCNQSTCGGTSRNVTSNNVSTTTNATRHFVAYVAQDAPGNYTLPSNDVRATSGSVHVTNIGWNGSVTLQVRATTTPNWVSVTATATAPLDGPYNLSIYDDSARLVAVCNQSTCGGTSRNTVSNNVSTTPGGHTYVAYVAQDAPGNYTLPTNDVRAISGRLSSAGTGPTSAGETSGGSNPSVACSDRCHADPVNTSTGEFWESTTDLAVTGSGAPLSVVRSYGASRSAVAGAFGYGWSSSLEMQIAISAGASGTTVGNASELRITQENGSSLDFVRGADGTYSAPARVQATLKQNPDGTFVLVRKATQTYRFDASGRLARMEDRNGQGVTLTRDSSGHVTTLSDDRGRGLTLTWSGAHVASAADNTGRTVSYGYSSDGDLTSVTAPDGSVQSYAYDLLHRMVSMTAADGGVTTNAYDTASRVVSQTDALERTTSFAYGDGQTTITDPDGSKTVERYVNGQVISETKAAGTTLEATTYFTYGPTNQVTSQTDALGRIATFTYDDAGNRLSATDPLGRTTSMTYNGFNEPLTVTNPAGETTTFVYDSHGNLQSKTDPTGAVTSFTVNPDGTVASATDATGNVTRYSYDAHGYLASTTDPTGAVTTAVFDAVGRQVSATDPRGNVTGAAPAQYTSTIAYDPAGRPLSTTDPYGSTTAMGYDAVGNVTSSTDQLGQVTTFTYDAAGQRLTATDPNGSVTKWSYDKAGRVATITAPDGGVTSYTYDAAGNRTSSTDADGRVTTSTFDVLGQVVSTTTPSGATTSYTYDAAGQVTKFVDPNGHATTTTYDQAGRPVTVTDALGRAVSTAYDKAGRTTQVTRADGSTLAWGYDAAGRQTSYTDASGAVTKYTYDAAGRLKTTTDTAGRVTAYAYDPAGHQATVTYPDGGTATSTYDRLGRLTGTTYSGTTPATTRAYDAASRVTTATSGSSSTTYVYDGAGRPTTVTTDGATVGYAWTAGGRLATLTYPGGNTVGYSYDAAGQLTKVSDWTGGDYQYSWTKDGQVDTLTYPNGVATHHAYDTAGQTTAITSDTSAGTQLLKLAYAYDNAGQLTSQTADRSTGPRAPPTTATTTSTYTWDPLGQLGQVTGTETGAYGFTSTGQLTQLPDGTTLGYDSAGQVTTRTAAAASDGTPGQVTSYTYNALGQRTGATTGDQATAYAYDQTGKLTSLTDPTGATSTYTYEASGLRSTTTTAAGTQRFVWDSTATVPELLSDGTHQYVYGVGSTPLAQVNADNSVDYLHTDQTGSVRSVTDHSGNVVADSDYSPYGTPTDINDAPVSAVTPFGYAGQYTDPTGLLYLRARYYDPTTGQFLTIDPLLATTHQPYAYTPGNPLQLTDPLGLDWLDNFSDGIAAFGDAITFGGTQQIRRLINYGLNGETEDPANSCTAAYKWGQGIGIATSFAIDGAGLVEFGAKAIAFGKVLHAADEGKTVAKAARAAETADEGSFLYRGLAADHPGLQDAAKGIAEPRGGHASPSLHNGGNTLSEFTSWTTDESIARDIASEGNGPGVVMRIANADDAGFSRVASPDVYNESEVLIKGRVTGADVLPWEPHP
ncbi:hypothetical protein CELD12_15850 [Cellulomonas sp. NTE-D12]|nr:hypothetical protein CELD12_15850 [Cellulomonas sp. NTE-D12]